MKRSSRPRATVDPPSGCIVCAALEFRGEVPRIFFPIR